LALVAEKGHQQVLKGRLAVDLNEGAQGPHNGKAANVLHRDNTNEPAYLRGSISFCKGDLFKKEELEKLK